MKRIFLSILLLSLPAGAQTTDPATKELIDKLLARIDGLEKRVAELEKEKAPEKAPVRTALTPAEAIHQSHDQPPPAVQLAGADAAPTYPRLHISGFSDINYSATTLHAPAQGFGAQTLLPGHNGFEEGQFTLHLSSALSPRVTMFGEITFTARSDAGIGAPPATGFNGEIERVMIRYDANDRFKLSFGRYHTPINYWNTAFHHGQWLQTSISRPEMTQFGGSFIPVHFVGSLVEGSTPAGGLNLNYAAGMGNGRGQILSRGGDFADINNNKAWLLNSFIKPDKLYGLQMGGAVYHDSLNPAVGIPAHEWIESGHIVWQKETPEFIAEFANLRDHPRNGTPAANSQAYYAQIAYRLPWLQKLWKPYYRFEYIHVPRADVNLRTIVPTFHASTYGIRYDITSFAAFKFEFRQYVRRDTLNFHGLFGQTSFTF